MHWNHVLKQGLVTLHTWLDQKLSPGTRLTLIGEEGIWVVETVFETPIKDSTLHHIEAARWELCRSLGKSDQSGWITGGW